jgi:exonuclease VII small subunit
LKRKAPSKGYEKSMKELKKVSIRIERKMAKLEKIMANISKDLS